MQLADAMKSVLGDQANTFGAIFDRMEFAEKEITAAQCRHPEHAGPIHESGFWLAMPTEILEGAGELAYRAHVAELLDRVAEGIDTRPPTRVELMCALAGASQRAPLKHFAATLYWELFAETFPAQGETIKANGGGYEFGTLDVQGEELRFGLEIELYKKDRKVQR